jgi:glycosyltransferase involved in cell wall biosynthesis
MRIHVYAVCWNEEVILPYFLRHYSAFAEKIVIFDNESSDRSPAIIDACPQAKRVTYKTGEQHYDRVHRECKMKYVESRGQADWVILVDMDEFVYHPDLVGVLKWYKRFGINFPNTAGFEMVSEETPTGEGQIWEYVKTGLPTAGYSKKTVFDPSLGVELSAGCHQTKIISGKPELGQGVPELKYLHYRWLGREFFIKRQISRRGRISGEDKSYSWGRHYQNPDDFFGPLFDSYLEMSRVVI